MTQYFYPAGRLSVAEGLAFDLLKSAEHNLKSPCPVELNLAKQLHPMLRSLCTVFSQQRTEARGLRLAMSHIFTMGDQTIARMLASSGRDQVDWSAEYRLFSRSPWETKDLFAPVVKAGLQLALPEGAPSDSPIWLAGDHTHLIKTGKKIPGVKTIRDPMSPAYHVNLVQGMRYFHVALLVDTWRHGEKPDMEVPARAVSLLFEPSPTVKKPGKKATPEDWKNYKRQLKAQLGTRQALADIEKLKEAIHACGGAGRRILIALDGAFSNRIFYEKKLPGVDLVSRTRKDSVLCLSLTAEREARAVDATAPAYVTMAAQQATPEAKAAAKAAAAAAAEAEAEAKPTTAQATPEIEAQNKVKGKGKAKAKGKTPAWRYGKEKFTPEQIRQNAAVPYQEVMIRTGGKEHKLKYKEIREVYWQRGAKRRSVRILVLAPTPYQLTPGSKLLYRSPAYLLTTDLTTPAEELIQGYIDRWQIEVAHREQKDTFGIEDTQVFSAKSVARHPAFEVAIYSMIHIAALRAYGPRFTCDYLKPAKWSRAKVRPSFLDMLQLLRHQYLEIAEDEVLSREYIPEGMTITAKQLITKAAA
jgi:hypothetical protein